MTKQVVTDKITSGLFNVFENGTIFNNQYRQDRFILKTKKLSVTIPRRNLPKFDTTIEPKSCSASRITTGTHKVFANTILQKNPINSPVKSYSEFQKFDNFTSLYKPIKLII